MRLLHRTFPLTIAAFATILLLTSFAQADESDDEEEDSAYYGRIGGLNGELAGPTPTPRPDSDVEIKADVEISGVERLLGEAENAERFLGHGVATYTFPRIYFGPSPRITPSGMLPSLESPSDLIGPIKIDLEFAERESSSPDRRRYQLRAVDVRSDIDLRDQVASDMSSRISRDWRPTYPEPNLDESATMKIVFRLENWPDDAELEFEVENLGSADLAPQVTERLEEYHLTAKYCAFGLEEMEDSTRSLAVTFSVDPATRKIPFSSTEIVETPFVDSTRRSEAESCFRWLLGGWELDGDMELAEDDGVKVEFVFP